jgi:hypothetical protein
MLKYCEIQATSFYSSDQMKKNEMGMECSTYGRVHRYVLGFGEKPEGKRPLGRLCCTCEDNIKIDVLEIG